MSTQSIEYTVRVHDEDDGAVWAEVLDLPGCFASGRDLDELRDALQEAISLYVSGNPERRTISGLNKQDMRVGEMRIKVPA